MDFARQGESFILLHVRRNCHFAAWQANRKGGGAPLRALARPCLARKGRPPSGWGSVRTAQRPLGLVDKASDFSSEDWAHADAREGGRAFGNRACRSRTPGATRARPRSAGHAFASTSKSLAAIMQLGKRQTEDRRAPARSRVSAFAYSPCILRGLGRRNATQFVKQEKSQNGKAHGGQARQRSGAAAFQRDLHSPTAQARPQV